MSLKKILYVEQNNDGTIGGSHYCLLEMVKYLDREKYEPVVAFYQDNSLVKEFRKYCSTILLPAPTPVNLMTRLPIKSPFLNFPVKMFQKMANLLKGLLIPIIKSTRLLIKHHIDLVHLNNSVKGGYEWILASKIAGAKCITHNRGQPRLSRIERFLVNRFDAVICIAGFILDDLKKQGVRIGRHFVVIHDGIDPDEIVSRIARTRNETRRLLNVGPDQPLIGIVGNIKRWKGQEVVIKATDLLVKKHPNLRCLVIGDVANNSRADLDYFHSLKILLHDRKLEDSVSLLGYRQDVPDLVNALDVLIHASIEPEPLGRVILEGMVLERPVIATNFGGPVEIIENGVSGILVPPGDEAALAQAVDSLLKDPAIRGRLAEAGKERVHERFHLMRNIQGIQDLYQEILS